MIRRAALICGLLALSIPSFAGSATDALIELALSTDTATFERHLPERLQAALHKAPPQRRQEFLKQLNPHEMLEREGGTVRRAESDANSLVVEDKAKGRFLVLTAQQEISDGANAVVIVRGCERKDRCLNFLASMRMESGEWRIVQFATGAGPQLDDPKLLDEFAKSEQSADESTAVGTMRTYNTAIVVYMTAYPEIGAPLAFSDLGGDTSQSPEPSSSHALLVDPVMACDQSACIKSGYVFRYTRTGKESYSISARPQQFGTSGTRSFYTDESGVIRVTEEDREPTAKDGPL
jgi:type IV pilus assembly protein PilA